MPEDLPPTTLPRRNHDSPGPRRLGHDRRRQADRGAEHVRHEDGRRRGDRRPGEPFGRRPGRAWCGSPSTRPRTPRPWPKSAAARRANLSVDLQENYRLAAEVAPWVDKIRYNPGHLYHHERQSAVAGQGAVPGRRGRPARLCPARGRELRLGRSGPTGEVRRGRRHPPDAAKRLGPLRAAGPAGVYALLRFAEGLGSGGRGGSQSAVCPSSGPTCRSTWA